MGILNNINWMRANSFTMGSFIFPIMEASNYPIHHGAILGAYMIPTTNITPSRPICVIM